MRFAAMLVTSRELQKPYQCFAPDQVNAEGLAREYLKGNGCEKGDRFEIYEIRPTLVRTIEWSDPKISHPATIPEI